MIILLHPRSTRPENRRFPLSILSIAAMLEGREDYVIIDGNLDPHPTSTLNRVVAQHQVELLAVSVMPGPQMVAAIAICKAFRLAHPQIPIVWGGYFPSLYTDATLNARYVDYVVRGQGENTFVDLIQALRVRGDLRTVAGLSFKDQFGLHVHNPARALHPPQDLPWLPYHRLTRPQDYVRPTFLGRRTAVHQTSIGCAFRCKFCGVVPLYDGRQKAESPQRTAAVLRHLQTEYGIDAVQFYDNNFFLNESHAVAQADAITPLRLNWWAEGRIDTMLRYSDDALRAIRRSGARMIFFGAESGSNEALANMNKKLTTDQTLALASRLRPFGIIPEFSFVVGNPADPEADTATTINFVRQIKRLNPDAEIIVQHYIPTPHPDGMYGGIDEKVQFPQTPDEWANERWYNFTTRKDPALPWLPPHVKQRIDGFETVLNARWPTIQDVHLRSWGRVLLKTLSSWRYALGIYAHPVELAAAQRLVALRRPRLESL